MTNDTLSAIATLKAPAETVIAVLADPTVRAAIDDTGWVREAPGQVGRDAGIQVGGWIWRYDLTPLGHAETAVTRSYGWSAVPQFLRDQIPFPPFAPDHLDNSLRRLAEVVRTYPAAGR